MRRNYTIGKRSVAMLLVLAMVFSFLPLAGLITKANAVGSGSAILEMHADANTMDSWRDAFNPTNINTEHAGGVWTDKSVIPAGSAANAFGNIAGLEVGENNFLVALSALAANSVVVGKGTTPTDTVLVLDVSGSMSAAELRAMVAAANDAIHTLLETEGSRVGVVLYSTSANVLLPLDRYTPVTETQNTANTEDDAIEYIEYTNSRIRAGRVYSGSGSQNNQNNYTYIQNGKGQSVTTSLATGGGTYIQGGIYAAYELFNSVEVTGARSPVLVLMSDGAPTFVSSDFANVPEEYESGDGNSSEDGEGFLTQLTAAYVKAQLAKKYNSTAYLYTLGLGVSAGNNTVTVAEAVLDTSETRAGMNSYWNTYLALANQTNQTMRVEVHEENWYGSGTTDVTVTYNEALSQDSQKNYVDKYFTASNASELSGAFKNIVNEISLKSSYYVTRLEGQDANLGGYVTFVDEIGTGMEVKEIEGILIGNVLYTGEKMAQALENGSLGTVENPTVLGDNMVWALVQRLDIKDTESQTAQERARDLLDKAYSNGQLSYNAEDGTWSNYIGWFGDANGDYIGFWDAADPNAVIPEGAAYANLCYGMLGATSADQTAHASDMMYVAVQVSKKITDTNGTLSIEANSPQTVTFRVPASLLPTITYQISVDLGSDEQITENTPATIAYDAAEPIRLVYEVGVHSQLTPENIRQFVREGYQAKDANGNYYLYTNAWNWAGADDTDWNNPENHPHKGDDVLKDTGKNAITYAYFEPGADNEHYYFTEDALVYVMDGDSYVPYEGSTKPSGTYYYKHLIYTATANGSAAVTATVTAHYEELTEAALLAAEQTDGAQTWYVPAGTMHRNTHDHDRNKVVNETGSFFAIRHQLVDTAVNGDVTHHYEILYLGNNGRITYAPAQGFTLTKVMENNAEAGNQSFPFTVTVSSDTDGKLTLTRNGVSEEKVLTSGSLQLNLTAGETVQVTGLDADATYTVAENDLEGFRISNIAARIEAHINNGTVQDVVQANTLHAITFVNDIQYYGELLISKHVNYLKNSQPATANTDSFTVKVSLAELGGKRIYVDGTATTLDADGTYTFTITDGKSVRLSGIPEGAYYTVNEVLEDGTVIPAGYAASDGYTAVAHTFAGNIDSREPAVAAIVNQYEPADVVFNDVAPRITVQTGKTVIGQPLNNWSFDFELLYYNGTSWEPVVVNGVPLTVTVDQAEGTDSFSLNGVKLTTVGKHYFRVAEIDPQIPGMTYDRTFHDFEVVVVDDLSGQLKIESVNSVQHAQVTPPAGEEDVWGVTTSFENEYEVGSTSLTIQANKKLWDITGGGKTEMAMQDGQFLFTLYTADENFRNLVEKETTRNGVAGQIIFTHIPYHFDPNSTETTYYYVVKETGPAQPGYTFDDAVYNIAVTVKQVSVGNTSEMQITSVTVNGNPVTLGQGNVLNGNTITFENVYEAEVATGIVLEGNKNLIGKDLDDDQFSFTMEGPDNYSETVFNKGDKFTFPALSFPKAGSYTYTIREVNGGAAGVTYDTKTITVTVDVEDNGAGKLIARIAGTEITGTYQVGEFTNTYKAAPVTGIVLSGTKDLQVSQKFNRPLHAGEFSFILEKPTGATETVKNDAVGNFAFSPLSFDQVGSYTYKIREVHGGNTIDGVTYDGHTITVVVVVEDPGNGQLIAKVADTQITGTYHAGVFQNVYNAQSVPVELTAYKFLYGDRELKANDFSFTLTKPDNTTETVKNDAEGLVAFSQITFDAVGEYVYTIVEDKLDENGNPLTPNQDGQIVYKGVTYSLAEYTVTVKITDNGSGQLVAHVSTVDAHGNELPAQFFNRYDAADVTVNLTGDNDKDGTKILDDQTSENSKDLNDFDFRFQLTDEAGIEIQTVYDNGNGFNFADITYTEPGEYVYYIRELDDGVPGVKYDTAAFKVTVKVEDNEEGNLVATVSYERITQEGSQKAEEVAFVNTYGAKETSVTFEGLKTLDGGRKLKENEFSFILKDEAGNELQRVSNAENGTFRFETISYTEEGKWVYTLEEVQGTDEQVTYDPTVYTLTVTVTDVNGELTAQVLVTVGEESKDSYGFTNLFTPMGATAEITVEKILDNRTNQAMGKDGFQFDLYCNETGITDTAESGTDGLAKLELVFSAADIGKTYTYKLSEREGDVANMEYSQVVYEIAVTVTQDQETGELVLTVTRDGAANTGNAQFVNILHEDVPKTGEEIFIGNWAVLMGVSAISLLAVLVLTKKKEQA